jgi:ankyrin repeat protein
MGHDPAKGLFLRERMLRKAAIAGDEVEAARLLKDGHLDVNFADPDANDYTALHEAANYGHLPVVELLVDYGADVNQRDRSGKAALYWAATLKHLSTMEFLLKHGAKADQPNEDGQTALFLAVELRHPEMVALLLKWRADPRKKDKRGVSPLDYARENGLKALLDLMAPNLGAGSGGGSGAIPGAPPSGP